ncbi:MAG: hypothetical protein JXM70_27725 [Pirellulales bacterium]|nr:hypothetical protein [Pirellulales bacterium]
MLNANRIKQLVYILVVVCIGLNTSDLPAQRGRQDRGQQGRGTKQTQRRDAAPQNKLPPVNLKGKIEAIKFGMVKIGTDDGNSWLVSIPRNAEIRVLGTAETSFLQPGQFVRFKAKIDAQGTAQEKVAKLAIFTRTQTSVLGFFPESGFSGGPDAAMEAEAEADTKSHKKKKERTKNKKPQLQAAVYEVNGQLMPAKRSGQWSVNTPQGSISFELAEDAELSVEIADYRYAKPGDEISCSAFQKGERMASARSVEIQLSEPLAGMEKKGKITRRSKSQKKQKSEETKSANGESKFGDKDKQSTEKTEELAQLLKPKGKFDTGESLELTIKGKSVTLGASTQGPAATLQKRFGRAKKSMAKGTITTADGAKGETVHWKIWSWGPVKVAVDKQGTARFYAVDEDGQ